jgi:hypothetical protein
MSSIILQTLKTLKAKMNSNNNNANNSEKNNSSNDPRRWAEARLNPIYLAAVREAQAASDEAFFAAHPQPTLEQSRALLWAAADARLTAAEEANPDQWDHDNEDNDDEYEEANEDEEEELDDEAEENEEEGMGLHNCTDVCACIRYFTDQMNVEEEEAEDQSLYERKRNGTCEAFIQNKSLKICHEHEQIPMDDEEDEEDEEDGEFICRHGLDCANQVCNDCVRALEEEDQYLYDLKRRNRYPNKSLKTYHEHEVIPMDISDDEEGLDENDELAPRQLFPDDDEDLLSIMSDIEIEACEDGESFEDREEGEDGEDREGEGEFICRHGLNCANQVCLDCVWYLEQEARHARRPVVAVAEEQEWDINVILEEQERDIPMDISEDEPVPISVPIPLLSQRQTTFWVEQETGETMYNGNPNGSRFYDEVGDDLSDLPDLIQVDEDEDYDPAEERYNFNMYELEVTYRDGQDVYSRADVERVAQLRRDIAEYESRRT